MGENSHFVAFFNCQFTESPSHKGTTAKVGIKIVFENYQMHAYLSILILPNILFYSLAGGRTPLR
jgi:hypothetical protein